MPTRAEQVFQEAGSTIINEVKTTLFNRRQQLINAGYLPAGYGDKTADDEIWTGLANEAIENRTLAGVGLSKMPIPGGGTLEQLVPRRDEINGIATDMAATVQEQEAKGNDFLGGASLRQVGRAFMKDMGGFLMALVMGLFQGKGMAGLKAALAPFIAPVVAEDMGNSLRGKLAARGITGERAEQIVHGFENGVLEKAGMAPRPSPISAAAGEQDATPIIRASVLRNLGLQEQDGVVSVQPAAPGEAKETTEGRARLDKLAKAAGVASFSPAQLKALTDTLTTGMGNAMDTIHKKDGEADLDYAKRIRDDIQTRLAANAGSIGIHNPDVQRALANGATVGYLDSRPAESGVHKAFKAFADGENAELEKKIITAAIRPEIINGLKAKAGDLNVMAGAELKDAHYNAIADTVLTLAPRVDAAKLKAMGGDVYKNVAKDIADVLTSDENMKKINTDGVKFSKEALTAMADAMAVTLIQKGLGAAAPTIPESFTKAQKEHEATVADALIRPLVTTYLADEKNIKQIKKIAGDDHLDTSKLGDGIITAMKNVAGEKIPITEPEKIRDKIKTELEKSIGPMFGKLNADEKNDLLTFMANQTTEKYLGKNDDKVRDKFIADHKAENDGLKLKLAKVMIRHQLTDEKLNMITLAIGAGQIKKDGGKEALIDTLAGAFVAIDNENEARKASGKPALADDEIRASIDIALKRDQEKIGMNGTTKFSSIVEGLADTYREKPDKDIGTIVDKQWEEMAAGVSPELLNKFGAVKEDIKKVLEPILQDKNFHTKSAEERRSILNDAMKTAFKNGAIPDGRNITLTGLPGIATVEITTTVAREMFADLISNKLTGKPSISPIDYLKQRIGNGVEAGGTIGGTVQGAADLTGMTPHLKNIDTGRLTNVVTGATEVINDPFSLTKQVIAVANTAEAAGSVAKYWWDKRPGWMK